jgi:hypothetical protein
MMGDEKRQRRTFAKRLRDVQDYFASVIPQEVSMVDELLQERRAEVEREDRRGGATGED